MQDSNNRIIEIARWFILAVLWYLVLFDVFLVLIKHDEKAVIKKMKFGASKVKEMCQVETLLLPHHVGLGLLK